ncbi:GH25 family lysozyme [Kiloniella laminariae]|uniref:Lysozyme n=1 Tax=Kiloniella laminariae TaxID=454162 RepID=A0ABT4LF12_9PROT|nr:GH25 family lysozyme [Kiloniella laminariae]MCZ4279692.1 GH25 family lysozyme [Kiloniella laminariae]
MKRSANLRRPKRGLVRGLSLFLVALTGLGLTGWFFAPHLELARQFHPLHGIDVSHHQGEVDWQQVAGEGTSFVYIKSTEGGDYVDPLFSANWQGTRAASLPRGAYHFFNLCHSGKDQAANFIATVPLEADMLPPVVDAEVMEPCQKPEDATAADDHVVTDVVAELTDFIEALQQHYGQRPVIYTMRHFDERYLKGKFLYDRFWIASMPLEPNFREDQWVIWQYQDKGKRAGITGTVDLNVLRSGVTDFPLPQNQRDQPQ